MPELPEVEAVVRLLRPRLCGQKIRHTQVIHAIVTRPQPRGGLQQRICGKRIAAMERRGKYLLLRLEPEQAGYIVLHFRLSGTVFWFEDHTLRGHVDVAFRLDGGTLAYADRRHLGRVRWLNQPEDAEGIRDLGIEPLSREFTAAKLHELLQDSRRPLKQFLMDQPRIAGIGNIYAAEALWRARLNPYRKADRLSQTEARRLHKAIVGVLRRGIECCLDPVPDLSSPEWEMAGTKKMLAVYQREGQPCRRCGAHIRRQKQGNRSTFYCPRCQR